MTLQHLPRLCCLVSTRTHLPATPLCPLSRLLSCSAVFVSSPSCSWHRLSLGLMTLAGSVASCFLLSVCVTFEVCLLPLDGGWGQGDDQGVNEFDSQARSDCRRPRGEVAAQPPLFPLWPVGGARCQPRPSWGLGGANRRPGLQERALSACQAALWMGRKVP